MELSLPDVPFGMGGDVRAAAHAGEPCRHGIVQVDALLEGQSRDHCGMNIRKAEARTVGHNMAAATDSRSH
jgi:hypothetical protein